MGQFVPRGGTVRPKGWDSLSQGVGQKRLDLLIFD